MVATAFEIYRADDLLPGEWSDLKSQVVALLGEEWPHIDNVFLGMRKPDDLIGTRDEYLVRDLLRSLSVSALT